MNKYEMCRFCAKQGWEEVRKDLTAAGVFDYKDKEEFLCNFENDFYSPCYSRFDNGFYFERGSCCFEIEWLDNKVNLTGNVDYFPKDDPEIYNYCFE